MKLFLFHYNVIINDGYDKKVLAYWVTPRSKRHISTTIAANFFPLSCQTNQRKNYNLFTKELVGSRKFTTRIINDLATPKRNNAPKYHLWLRAIFEPEPRTLRTFDDRAGRGASIVIVAGLDGLLGIWLDWMWRWVLPSKIKLGIWPSKARQWKTGAGGGLCWRITTCTITSKKTYVVNNCACLSWYVNSIFRMRRHWIPYVSVSVHARLPPFVIRKKGVAWRSIQHVEYGSSQETLMMKLELGWKHCFCGAFLSRAKRRILSLLLMMLPLHCKL